MKKQLVLLFIVLFGVASASAQDKKSTGSLKQDSLLYSTTLYFHHNNSLWIDVVNFDEICDLYYTYKSDTAAKLKIEVWADSSGTVGENEDISLQRAETVRKFFIKEGVSPTDIILTQGNGIDYAAVNDSLARRAEVRLYLIVDKKPKAEVQAEEVKVEVVKKPIEMKYEVTVVKEEIKPAIEESIPVQHHLNLRANLLYFATGIINVGAEYRYEDSRLGYLVNGGYSTFANTSWNKNMGGWFISPEVRYYFCEKQTWFAGVQFLAGGYNYKMSDIGYQGTVLGGGVTGGYKLTLNDTFDMDFSMGLGYGSFAYDSYKHNEKNTNTCIEQALRKNSIIPIQLGVSLIWKIR